MVGKELHLAIAGQLRKCSNVQLHASGMTENVARLSSGYIKYFLRDGNGNRKYYLLNTGVCRDGGVHAVYLLV